MPTFTRFLLGLHGTLSGISFSLAVAFSVISRLASPPTLCYTSCSYSNVFVTLSVVVACFFGASATFCSFCQFFVLFSHFCPGRGLPRASSLCGSFVWSSRPILLLLLRIRPKFLLNSFRLPKPYSSSRHHLHRRNLRLLSRSFLHILPTSLLHLLL